MDADVEKQNELKIAYFTERVNHYFFEVFHMYDYELEIIGEESEGLFRARTYWHPIESGAGNVTISYATEWINDDDTTLEEVDRISFHEVCECLLSELQQLIRGRFIMEKDIPNAVHRVIRRMENTIFNLIKDNKENKK